jgi:DUF1680 family protein
MHKIIAGLVDIYKFEGNNDTLQIVGKLGDDTFKLINKHSGKVLGIDQMSATDGANAVQWSDNATRDQSWRFVFVR